MGRKLQKKVRPCSGYTGKDKKECKRLTGKDGNGIRNKGLCAGKTRKECNALICEGEDCTPFCEQEKEKKRMRCMDKCNRVKDTKCTAKDGGKKIGICEDKTRKECRELICTAEEDCETLCVQEKENNKMKCVDKCNQIKDTKCTEKDGGKKKGICKDKTKKECREFICTAEEDCETLCAQLKKKKNEKCIDKCNLVRATKCK